MACLSLNDQAFIFIIMTFPSFITTGGTVDIPTVPLERKALDLTPLIQQLMMNKKTSSSAEPSKKDGKDPDIKGTIGQTEQWNDNYQRNQREINNLFNWYGADVAVRQPEYQKLVNEQANITNPAIVARLANNKQRLDDYDALIKEKKASGLINLDMLARTSYGLSHGDWSYLMQYAQINSGLAVTDPGAFAWMEDFSYSPYIATYDDALTALDKRFSHIGTSEYSSGGGSDSVYDDLHKDWAFLVAEHNTSMTTKKSNDDLYGENPTGIGQLNAAKQAALKDAFSGFLAQTEGDDLANGLAGKFLLMTAETVAASKIGIPGGKSVKAIFQTKAYKDKFAAEEPNANDFVKTDGKLDEEKYKKAYEEWETKNKEAGKNYYKTHDGYYYKAGQKDKDGKDISGLLDENALLGDYERFVTELVDSEHNKRIISVDSFKSDQNKTITATDSWQAKKDAEVAIEQEIAVANQENISIATEGNVGIPEGEFNKLFPGSDSFELFGEDWLNKLVYGDQYSDTWEDIKSKILINYDKKEPKISASDLQQMEYQKVSPFLTQIDNAGNKTYKPNPDFVENIEIFKQSMIEVYKSQGADDAMAEGMANDLAQKAIRSHKTVTDNILSRGQAGSVIVDATRIHVPTSDDETLNWIAEHYFEGEGDNKIGKTAQMLFGNQLAQVGMTVTEGAGFFGDAFRYRTMQDGYNMVNLGLASNAGAKVKYGFTLNNQKYNPGDFIHASLFDQMTPKQLKEFKPSVDFGTNGYWNIENGKAIRNGYPNKKGKVTGANENSEMIYLELGRSGGPNAVAESITSITTNMELVAKKEDAIAMWKKNGTQLAKPVPAYTSDPKKNKVYEEADKQYRNLRKQYTFVSDQDEKAGKYSADWKAKNDAQFDKWALSLNIKKGTPAYKELEKVKTAFKSKGSAEPEIHVEEAIAIRDGIGSSKNWARQKVARYENIIDESGNVKDFAKEQMYLREIKSANGDILYNVTTGMEITAETAKANPVKAKMRVDAINNRRFQQLTAVDQNKPKEYKGNPLTK